MEQTKQWWWSKGVWGSIATIILSLFLKKGWIDVDVAAAITAGLGVWGVYARGSAKSRLTLKAGAVMLLASLLLVGGCSKVQMSSDYGRVVEQSALVVGELSTRCQGGDDLACKEGLRVAAEMLDLVVDAMHGIDSKGAGHE